MIAFHFPPLAGSSGIQRTLRLVQHLPALGWQPLVLTVGPAAYEQTGGDLVTEVPHDTVVRRAIAFDTARHLALRGRYFASMARPDRWVSWQWDGVRQGLQLIREYRPEVIWSTYPIATAHVIGQRLHASTGLPWIADFRDPMAQEGYPADPVTWGHYQRIERLTLQQAALSVFTTPGAADLYRKRYPTAARRIAVIENGYDEDTFANIPEAPPVPNSTARRPAVLLHSGIVYPSERDPTQFFAALRILVDSGGIHPGDLLVRFRAAVHDELLRGLASQHGVQAYVDIVPSLPYREALAEMVSADALLVLQASNCNEQIPAKIYEYLRAGRPIIALTDQAGDTAGVLRQAGLGAIAPLDSARDIAALLQTFVPRLRAGSAALPDPSVVKRASRKERAAVLAAHLNHIAGTKQETVQAFSTHINGT